MPDDYFVRHQKRIMKVLEALEKKPLRHKEILALWLPTGASLDQLSRALRWMKAKGYIRKTDETKRRSPYEITPSGRKYLEGLKA